MKLEGGVSMSSPKRRWYPGACYHITNRGNHRNDIFRDEDDFGMYLLILMETLKYYKEFSYKIICYCLMTNHVHFLIKTENKDVSNLMRRLNSIYARYFNKKYNYVGHLYQDRFYAEQIEDDAQMLLTSRYIHLNPVRARMVALPQDYKWSSYRMFIGSEEVKIIQPEYILNYFEQEKKYELYKEFVECKIKESEEA